MGKNEVGIYYLTGVLFMAQKRCYNIDIPFVMAEKAVRKTTKKKAVRKTATKKVAPKKVPTKKSVKKTVRPVASSKQSTIRKAPTPVAAQNQTKKNNRRMLIGSFVFFVVVIGVSAVVGISDKGQINIDSTIAYLKEHASPEERKKIDTASAVTKQGPSALVPSGIPVEEPASKPFSTTTDQSATTTISSASSTDALAEDTEDVETQAEVASSTATTTTSEEIVE